MTGDEVTRLGLIAKDLVVPGTVTVKRARRRAVDSVRHNALGSPRLRTRRSVGERDIKANARPPNGVTPYRSCPCPRRLGRCAGASASRSCGRT